MILLLFETLLRYILHIEILTLWVDICLVILGYWPSKVLPEVVTIILYLPYLIHLALMWLLLD